MVVLYRPPKQSNFYSLLEEKCTNGVRFCDLETIIMGDFNTNVNAEPKNYGLLKNLKYYCYLFGMKQLITEPTRVTNKTQTVLDLILASDP